MRILLPTAAALIPLALLPNNSFYFDITPKIVILLLIVSAALLLWNGSVIRGPMALLLSAQLLWLAVATLLSRHPALSLNGSNWRRFGLVSYGAVLLYAILAATDVSVDSSRLANYLRAAALGTIPVALYGIAQYFGYDPFLNQSAYHSGEGIFTIVRPPSTLGHASYLGTYLVYGVFFGVALYCTDRTRMWRLTGVTAAAMGAVAMILSGTRGALAGLIAGFGLLVMRWPAVRRPRSIYLTAALTAVLALFCISPAGAALRSRIHWSIEEPVGGARPQLWVDTLHMAGGRVLAGYGPETFTAEFPRFQSTSLARAFPDFQHESPHNILLDALVSQGILGVALLAATAGFALWTALGAASILSLVLAAALLGGFAAQMFTSFTMPTALFFYLTAAMLCGGRVARATWIWRALASAAAVGLLAWGSRLAVADYQLSQVRQALARDDFRSAVSSYEKARLWYPSGSSADLYFSRELANLFQRTRDARLKLQIWTPAFQSAVRAASTSENPAGAFYNLAIFFATQNDAPDVERSLRTAIAWAPRWFKPHWALSQLLQQQGFLPQARAEAERAKEIQDARGLK